MSKYYKDIESYITALSSTIQDTEKYLTEKLDKHANLLITDVKSKTPVDTGNLRNSWKRGIVNHAGNKYSVNIDNEAKNPDYGSEYATYVEFGHNSAAGNWVPGRFMLRTAQQNAIHNFEQDLKNDEVRLFSKLV